MRRLRLGAPLAGLALAAGLGAAEPAADTEDSGLLAMARLQPGLQRGHVALYFGGAVTAQGLGLPAAAAFEALRQPEGSVVFRFTLPTHRSVLTFTLPSRGPGNYPLGAESPFSGEFSATPLEGTVHFERFDEEALSGWFFLRHRDATGRAVQTAGGAFREIPWAKGLR